MEDCWQSVGDKSPADQGGPDARNGFVYQDMIAVGCLIQMLRDRLVLNVQCETHDDIVVVREDPDTAFQTAEYVQVKSTRSDTLWSTAMLCERVNGGSGPSIVERSLKRDAHCEAATFRIVTLRDVKRELKALTHPLGSDARMGAAADVVKLHTQIAGRLPDILSPKGHDIAFWLENLTWDVRHGEGEIRNANLAALQQFAIDDRRIELLTELDRLHDELLAMVREAARKDWDSGKADKIIARAAILAWWRTRQNDAQLQDGRTVGSPDRDYAKTFFENRWPETSRQISEALDHCDQWIWRLNDALTRNDSLPYPYESASPWIDKEAIAATAFKADLSAAMAVYKANLGLIWSAMDYWDIVHFPRSTELGFFVLTRPFEEIYPELKDENSSRVAEIYHDRIAKFLEIFSLADADAAKLFLRSEAYSQVIASAADKVRDQITPLKDAVAEVQKLVRFLDIAIGRGRSANEVS